jgi:hypothetical protein
MMNVQCKLFSIILLGLILLSGTTLQGQERFGAGVIFGLNAAQVHGDDMAGYNQLGLRTGLRGTAILDDNQHLSMDILYSRRGASSTLTPNNAGFPRRMRLDYVEVPILYNYKEWLSDDASYYRVHFFAGLSYGRLFNVYMEGFPVLEDEADNFHRNDYSGMVGATYMVSEKFGFTVSWARSINFLYNNDKHRNAANIPIYKVPLTGYFFSFQSVLYF